MYSLCFPDWATRLYDHRVASEARPKGFEELKCDVFTDKDKVLIKEIDEYYLTAFSAYAKKIVDFEIQERHELATANDTPLNTSTVLLFFPSNQVVAEKVLTAMSIGMSEYAKEHDAAIESLLSYLKVSGYSKSGFDPKQSLTFARMHDTKEWMSRDEVDEESMVGAAMAVKEVRKQPRLAHKPSSRVRRSTMLIENARTALKENIGGKELKLHFKSSLGVRQFFDDKVASKGNIFKCDHHHTKLRDCKFEANTKVKVINHIIEVDRIALICASCKESLTMKAFKNHVSKCGQRSALRLVAKPNV